jgi:hypothetical protein
MMIPLFINSENWWKQIKHFVYIMAASGRDILFTEHTNIASAAYAEFPPVTHRPTSRTPNEGLANN